MDCAPPRISRRRRLIALTVTIGVVEAVVLSATGRNVALAAHVSAPTPYGTFHDVRWLLAYHPHMVALVLEAVAAVVLRGLFIATAVRAAWPRDHPPPTLRVAFWRGTMVAAVGLLLLAPWAVLLFGMAVTPVSWLWFAGVAPVLVLAPLTHQAAVAGVWFRRPTIRSAAWSVLTFFVLCLGGAAMALAPTWWLAVAAAAATGLFHAWAWLGVVHALVCTDGAVSRFPVAPVAVTAFVTFALGVSSLAFDAITGGPAEELPTEGLTEGTPVLMAAGFRSSWDCTQDDLLADPYREVQYSYRGLDEDGDPLPYGPADTHAPLQTLAERMARQVEVLHRRTGRPVSIVAQSEGSLVAEAVVATSASGAIDQVVLLSPLLHPAGVYYPPTGTDGWGAGGRWALEGMTTAIGRISPYDADPGLPFLRSVVDHGPALRSLARCTVARDGVTALVPVTHGLASPPSAGADIDTHAVAAFHAGFLGAGHDDTLIRAALRGESLPGRGFWQGATVAASGLAASWQVPRVPLGLPMPWTDQPGPVSCEQLGTILTD